MATKQPTPSYQDMLHELDAVLVWFQSDQVDLDQAISKYEQGMDLVQKLETQLKTAENNIIKVKQRFDA